ncbi:MULTISPECIES: hypothetical protein [unclassified Streptomyces]|uniref:hypothetical protein n=1 Tax=unclassified Streptomyces TaxID=2593676 RepID=UPI0033CB7229
MTHVLVAVALVAGALGGTSAAAAAPAGQVAAARCAKLVVTGKRVAVRRPWHGRSSASWDSPVHHYVRKGTRLRSCRMTFNRGNDGEYRKCGKIGQDWYLVRGGQIPETCVKRA